MLKNPETRISYDQVYSNMYDSKILITLILTWSWVDNSVNNVSSAAFRTEDMV